MLRIYYGAIKWLIVKSNPRCSMFFFEDFVLINIINNILRLILLLLLQYVNRKACLLKFPPKSHPLLDRTVKISNFEIITINFIKISEIYFKDYYMFKNKCSNIVTVLRTFIFHVLFLYLEFSFLKFQCTKIFFNLFLCMTKKLHCIK